MDPEEEEVPTEDKATETEEERAAREKKEADLALLIETEEAINAVKMDLQRVQKALEAIPQLLVDSASTEPAVVDRAKETVASWSGFSEALNKGWSQLGEILTRLDPTNATLHPVFLAILRLQGEQNAADESLEQLTSFAELMIQVDTPLDIASIIFNPQTTAEVKISTAVNEENSKVAHGVSPSVDPTAQKIVVKVKPYSPIRLGYGGALVYSFVDDPSFSTEMLEGGGFRIVEESGSNDFVGQKVAAMLTLTPRAWERGTLAGEIHLGINPEQDAIGFFVGAGIRFTNIFSFGVGLTFQEVDKLGNGLTLDSILESADQLKLDQEFDTGFYIIFTATTR